jgi:hypothetical protein
MQELAGVLVLEGLLAAAGLGVLRALGLRAGGLPGVGLALATGWAAVGVICSLAVVAGLSLQVWQVTLFALATAAAGAFAARRREPASRPLAPELPGRLPRVGAVAGAAVLAVALAAGLARALTATADTEWDSWAFWTPKTLTLYYEGSADGFTELPSAEYPPLAAALDAAVLRFAGDTDPSVLVLHRFLVLAAALLGAGALLRRTVPASLVWPPLAMLALAPAVVRYFDSVLADPAVATASALAGAAGAVWLLERRAGPAVLAALFAAAATLVKTDGLLLAYLLVVFLALGGGFRRPRELALLAVAPAAVLLPWKLWLARHDAPLSSGDYDFARALDPGYLADRVDRLGFALREMAQIAFSVELWLLVLPLALAAALLAAPRRPALAALTLGWPVAGFLGLAGVYWISPLPVDWYVDTSAPRILLSVIVISASLLPLSLGQLVPAPLGAAEHEDDQGGRSELEHGPGDVRARPRDRVAVVQAADGDRGRADEHLGPPEPRPG